MAETPNYTSDFQRRAVILTALPIERTAVLEHLQDVREETHPHGSVYRRARFEENSEPWDVLLAEIGPGNESSAAAVERAINYFRPEVALFVGIAGAIKDLSRGDVVAATKVYNYGYGKDSTSHFQTRPETELAAYSLSERARYEAGEKDWLQRIRSGERTEMLTSNPWARVGPIAAGPKIVASTNSATYKFIRQHYGDALAVEMEGHGFLIGVRMSPVQGIVVRGISDCIDDKTADNDRDWQPIAARHAAAFAFQILAKLPDATEQQLEPGRGRARAGISMDVAVLNEDASSWNRGGNTILHYSLERDERCIHIKSNLGYFSDFKAGGRITPINYLTETWCAFQWDFPILDFKIVNNSPTTVFLSEVKFDIEESRPDLAPFFTIKKDTQQRKAGSLLLINEGWCDLRNVVICFNLSPGESGGLSMPGPPYRHTVDLPLLSDREEIDVTKAFQDEGVDINGLICLHDGQWESPAIFVVQNFDGSEERIPASELDDHYRKCLGAFHASVGTLAGQISFATTEDGSHRHQVEFLAVVYLENKNRTGVFKPPTYSYDAIFDDDNTAYQRLVQISHDIQPGKTERFTVKIAVPRSSSHRFRAAIRDVGGLVLASPPIEMNCFVPRSRRDAVARKITPRPAG